MLDIYTPLKRIDKYKLRFKSKPWITLGLQRSILVKNKLLTKFINMKHPILKEETYIEFKNYRNMLSALMKKSKQAYYNKYFETNWNNIKNTRKGIKSLISLKTVASSAPTMLACDNGNTIINPYDTANNYIPSIAETTKTTTYSHKHFSNNLKQECENTIFLKPNSKEEIGNIISSLNSNKASGPNTIPYIILFLLKNKISMQLADLFNLSSVTVISPSVFKTTKVVPVFKKDLKLHYSNYSPVSQL